MTERLRAFIDSNILFSASHASPNNFEMYWQLLEVDILTSQYSIAEVSRNLRTAMQRARLWGLIYRSHLVPNGDSVVLPANIQLPPKDQPILQAAIAGHADLLVTGDSNHFGAYFGHTVAGVVIVTPAMFRSRFDGLFG